MSEPLDELLSLLGPKGYISGSEAQGYTVDVSGRSAPCLAVLRPASTQEVVAAVKVCAAHNLAIIAQGGNSNVCQMTVPEVGQDSVILNLSRMNHILDVDAACSTITAEAGCTLQSLQQAAANCDRLFAPDWGARGTAQIGGAVATNGGGQNVFRYGTTREQVLGMEVVLSDGRILNVMRSLRKDNSGYDLKHLFIGSEGTLGIITKVVFKLHPSQPVTNSMMAVLKDQSHLIEYLNLAKKIAGDQLIAFELLNGVGVEKALAHHSHLVRPFETRADWYVLIRLADNSSVDDTLNAIFEQGFEQEFLDDAVMAQTLQQERNLWELREQMIPMQYFKDRTMCKWDVSVPIDKIVEFLDCAKAIAVRHQKEAVSYAVGHVGDGNIHYSIFPVGPPGPELDALADRYTRKIDQLIWSLDGSIVAEHGVGAAFVERMKNQKTLEEYETMQQLKAMFDPLGIMNPGKLLNPPIGR